MLSRKNTEGLMGLEDPFYFTADLRAFPAENFGERVAGIMISLPVRGFRPFLAFLRLTEKVPKPTKVTF